ncbi:phosphoenolpyruvate hydrolase family protein [Phytohabitans sp. ZYX-F-186]|uniref:Phosphoenolpyruvate hydrolase family protein n=1 Tax=Phytohabitans maris TaxID=3071409 RepID=A0ABU0ZKH3_9ACTN|nr:phosphoenolpyruvate hydrolase family protein [Phytohabitans sp. ZYX-F-186]MDQ7907545.1 phosphoenolpyruvate hydrolase family protein [Phytohabitans sp. ZYX-F-186]
MIIVYNSGKYRMAGRGSTAGYLCYGDGNGIVADMAPEVIPMAADVPVVAGVCGTDPFRIMRVYLEQLVKLGYCGVQNFPTVGLIDGLFRQSLEETGMGYDKEVEMIREAAGFGLLTTPYVFTEEEARLMVDAGADIIVAHMGVTVKGTIGAQTSMSLDDAVARCDAIAGAAKAVNPEVLVLCHGGPIAEQDEAAYVFQHSRDIVGFYGASSTERIPTERAMTAKMREFKALNLTR